MEKLSFDQDIKRRYYIRRDDCGSEYVALRGPKALGHGGLDHIYRIGPDKIGLWITSKTIKATVRRLRAKVPDLEVEQLGDAEAVLSAPLDQLDRLCEVAGARVRPQFSEDSLSNKREAIRKARASLPLDREAS